MSQPLSLPLSLPVQSFDFHCHSTVSDGFLPPEAVVAEAAKRGVRHLALTDHDDVGGLAAAREAALSLEVRFVSGVEISIAWEGIGIHIVGLNFDPANSELLAALAWIREGRIARAEKMSRLLAEAGIPGTLEGARRHASNPNLLSRAHFARYLAEIGLFSDPKKVFDHYLSPGKPGYVVQETANLSDSISWIHAAGGIAVVAHPGRYKMSGGQTRRFLSEFREKGGEAIEVSCGSHGADQLRHFARLAREYGFHASGGSDFHGETGAYARLGEFLPIPEDLRPVTRLLEGKD